MFDRFAIARRYHALIVLSVVIVLVVVVVAVGSVGVRSVQRVVVVLVHLHALVLVVVLWLRFDVLQQYGRLLTVLVLLLLMLLLLLLLFIVRASATVRGRTGRVECVRGRRRLYHILDAELALLGPHLLLVLLHQLALRVVLLVLLRVEHLFAGVRGQGPVRVAIAGEVAIVAVAAVVVVIVRVACVVVEIVLVEYDGRGRMLRLHQLLEVVAMVLELLLLMGDGGCNGGGLLLGGGCCCCLLLLLLLMLLLCLGMCLLLSDL